MKTGSIPSVIHGNGPIKVGICFKVLKYKGSHSLLYNVKTGTIPIIIHGNGPIKVVICL